ncbi:MAG: 3-oxoacyl-ACP reductase [Solirubrobacteraceae bacterium]|nr:3-oxoacyl-ACP reductase [Solirubrobacteraceae bacterium]
MTDRYRSFVNSAIGRQIAPRLGLPQPPVLQRHRVGDPVVDGPVLVGAAPGGRLAGAIARTLAAVGAETWTTEAGDLRQTAADAGLAPKIYADGAAGDQRFKALVLDATGIADVDALGELHAFFHPVARRLQGCGRIIVLGTTPELLDGSARIAQRALEGFTRSTGKEIKRGVTSQLVYVAPDAEDRIASTLRFLLSPRSAFVSGQVVRIMPSDRDPELNWSEPLKGKVALVTGASRGIGEAIAQTLARDGAHVVGLDIAPLADELAAVTGRIGGSAITLDVTDDDAGAVLAERLKADHGGVDVVVHNAGITRDKTLGNMKREVWDQVLAVNLRAPEAITRALLDAGTINRDGRIVGVASIAGIAGNFGQTNYATSKAGVIGLVDALAADVAARDITINAVAPGFIETQMTAKVPLGIREAGRRLSSLGQGGLPVDVAETIAWYASPASAGVNGNVVRVCGQSLLGA